MNTEKGMNEQDFRNELRRTMATLPARPEMSDADVIDAAHRDLKRRRTMWAGVGSAAAVIAVAVGVAIVAPSATEGSGGVDVADQSESAQAAQTGDRGAQLAAVLVAVAPAGYESPDDLVGSDGKPLKQHYRNYDVVSGDGTEGWAYTADLPLKKGKGTGTLSVTVFGPNEHRTARETCAVNPAGINPEHCAELTVGDKKVGLFTNELDGAPRQMAVFMYDDTAMVAISQSAGSPEAGLPPLDGLPFSGEQLAALAVDPRFKIQ